MIQPLRQNHRRIFIVLGVLLPVLFGVGVLARKPLARASSLPEVLAGMSENFPVFKGEPAGLFLKVPVRVQLWREHTDTGAWAIHLAVPDTYARPDVLVYWVPGNVTVTDTLPEQAKLLGPWTAAVLPLPRESSTTNGTLILYSLADNEILDCSRAATFGAP